MPNHTFTLNGKKITVDAPDDLSVLWTLRDKLGVTGPKYGCGINVCQACTSHVDGEAFNPCVTTVQEIEGRRITTIEGLAKNGKLHPVQQAWLEQDVPQCGFCQPGQIMAVVALLAKTRNPTDADIDTIDNVCRCGTYFRIRTAIKRSVELMDAADRSGTVVAASGPSAGGPTPVLASLPTTGVPAAAATAAAALVAAGALGARAVSRVGGAEPA